MTIVPSFGGWAEAPPQIKRLGAVLSSLQWTTVQVAGSGPPVTRADFVHWDDRPWVAQIQSQSRDNGRDYVLTLTSFGCRPHYFFSTNFGALQQVALRFANLSVAKYDRLTADAQSLQDWPRPGSVVLCRIEAFTKRTDPGNSVTWTPLARLARRVGGTVTLFPDYTEFVALFADCLVADTWSELDDQVNAVPLPSIEHNTESWHAPTTEADGAAYTGAMNAWMRETGGNEIYTTTVSEKPRERSIDLDG